MENNQQQIKEFILNAYGVSDLQDLFKYNKKYECWCFYPKQDKNMMLAWNTAQKVVIVNTFTGRNCNIKTAIKDPKSLQPKNNKDLEYDIDNVLYKSICTKYVENNTDISLVAKHMYVHPETQDDFSKRKYNQNTIGCKMGFMVTKPNQREAINKYAYNSPDNVLSCDEFFLRSMGYITDDTIMNYVVKIPKILDEDYYVIPYDHALAYGLRLDDSEVMDELGVKASEIVINNDFIGFYFVPGSYFKTYFAQICKVLLNKLDPQKLSDFSLVYEPMDTNNDSNDIKTSMCISYICYPKENMFKSKKIVPTLHPRFPRFQDQIATKKFLDMCLAEQENMEKMKKIDINKQ